MHFLNQFPGYGSGVCALCVKCYFKYMTVAPRCEQSSCLLVQYIKGKRRI